jgi:divalent metal cation (Fe/Co/Zn/Cd) transporter
MSTKSTLVYSLAVNVVVIGMKTVVGVFSGSAAMLAEASHSLVDSLTGPLLLVGEWHGKSWAKGPHFWGLIAAVNMALMGGGFAAWEGLQSIIDPEVAAGLLWASLAVLAASALLESTSLVQVLRTLAPSRDGQSWLAHLRTTSNNAMKTQAIEDGLDVAGLSLAIVGTALQLATGSAVWTGAAAVLIAVLLTGMAVELGRSNAKLLIAG